MAIIYEHDYGKDLGYTELFFAGEVAKAIYIATQLEINLQTKPYQGNGKLIFIFDNINDRTAFIKNAYNPQIKNKELNRTVTFKENATPQFKKAWKQAVEEITENKGIECSIEHTSEQRLTIHFNNMDDLTIHRNWIANGRYTNRANEILAEQNLD